MYVRTRADVASIFVALMTMMMMTETQVGSTSAAQYIAIAMLWPGAKWRAFRLCRFSLPNLVPSFVVCFYKMTLDPIEAEIDIYVKRSAI